MVWSNGYDSISGARLAWALANGSNAYEFEDLGFVAWVMWSGETFAYASAKEERWSVGLVNSYTGTHQILLDNLVRVDSMEAYGGGVTFRWQTADGQAGFDTYGTDGERIHRFILAGAAIPVDEGNFPRTLFWSPNGSRALLLFDADGSRGVQLASADGESHVIRASLPWVYPPYWSPDGHMLALVTPSPQIQGLGILEVITADGADVGRFEQLLMDANTSQMTWTRCEPRLR